MARMAVCIREAMANRDILVGYILYEDGVWLQRQYEQGRQVFFDFIKDDRPVGISLESYTIGRINSFSSWGPTLDARMKPDISAPGLCLFDVQVMRC